ncbi:hypothetical protein DFH06DRAFT_1150443 [Mycena polygramma]|nr:hypothetical protein DFH06DRAFT_1150443 [Mycena polygramma]
MSESPVPGSLNIPDLSALATPATGTIAQTGSMAQTGSAALNSYRPEDTFPSDTPASFIIANSFPLPTPGPPPPPKDLGLHITDSNQGAAPPVPTKDSTAPPMKDSTPPTPTLDSHSQSSGDDSGSGEENTEDGTTGKKKKRKLLQRLKEKLHVGHPHDEEAA